MKAAYLFRNPYRMVRKQRETAGEKDVYQYGETPIHTMEKIAHMVPIQKGDLVYELGSGRGRTSLFLASKVGCSVVGFELLPAFAETANRIAGRCSLDAKFYIADFLKLKWDVLPQVIYLYGTCLEDKQIRKLVAAWESFPPDVRIVTVSYPLSDYSSKFFVERNWEGEYLWGKATIYLNRVKIT